MKKRLVFLFFFLVAIPCQAEGLQWKIDPVHTNFYFEVRHTYAAVRGRFSDFAGEVFFDPDKPEKSRFAFVIKAASVDTRVVKRDTHLRSPDFFDAARYPLITFTSTRVLAAGPDRYIAEGTLSIKDVTRKVSLAFDYHGQRENPLKKGEIVAGLDTVLRINRLEYHVGDGRFYKMGVVGRDIDILVTLELLRESP